jgi:hypothetical protein
MIKPISLFLLKSIERKDYLNTFEFMDKLQENLNKKLQTKSNL